MPNRTLTQHQQRAAGTGQVFVMLLPAHEPSRRRYIALPNAVPVPQVIRAVQQPPIVPTPSLCHTGYVIVKRTSCGRSGPSNHRLLTSGAMFAGEGHLPQLPFSLSRETRRTIGFTAAAMPALLPPLMPPPVAPLPGCPVPLPRSLLAAAPGDRSDVRRHDGQ